MKLGSNPIQFVLLRTRTHAFGRLEAARFVRIKVSTDLRWFGHDEKCFRFELLGCKADSLAVSQLTTKVNKSIQLISIIVISTDSMYILFRYSLLQYFHELTQAKLIIYEFNA